MKLIHAKFAGKCGKCKLRIESGDWIRFAKGEQPLHNECYMKKESTPIITRTDSTLLPGMQFDGKTYSQHFDSLSAHCTEPLSNIWHGNRARLDSSYLGNNKSWHGIEGGVVAVKALIATGWQDGVDRVEASLSALALPPLKGIRRRRIRTDFGDSFDIHRALAGDSSRAWEVSKRRLGASGRSTRTLIVNTCNSAGTTAEELFWTGAAALAYCDALTMAGYSVEIIGANATQYLTNSQKHGQVTWLIKPTNAPLDKAALASCLCLAGYFRTTFWEWGASIPETICSSYGQCTTPDMSAWPDAIAVPNTLTSQARAQAWLDTQLATMQEAA